MDDSARPKGTVLPSLNRRGYHSATAVRETHEGFMEHRDRFVPAETNSGWGFATGVIVLAIALIAWATYVHKTQYKHPTDVTMRSHGGAASAAVAPAH